ncbi:MAG TPA: Gldg family protein [Leptolyngbyaceae cyanobacterium]
MKTIVAYRKYLKYLALLGLGLVTAGLVAGLASGWGFLTAGLLFGGIGLLLVGLAFSDAVQGRFWQQRSTEAGANALIATLAVLAILGLVNFLAVRYSSRIDMTENQIFTLAPQSQEIVRSLDQPVKAVIFDTNQNTQDRQLLSSYQRLGKNFSYEYVDPYANPQRAQQFQVTQPGTAFLEQGEKRQFLQNLGPEERLSERTLTNALDQLVRDRTLTVYFTQGHQEYPIDGTETGFFQAASALKDKNYVVKPLNLAETPQIPEDASVVVVAGPAKEFFDKEVEALKTYLDKSGSVLLLVDPRTNPNLGSLLDEWGVTLDNRVVLDTSGTGQLVGLGPAAPLVTDYGDHPITNDFKNGRSFYPLARPVEIEEVPNVTAVPLIKTNTQSRAEALSEKGDLKYDPNAAPQGPFTLGVALSRSAGSTQPPKQQANETPAESRLVVIGNASFATDGIFEQQLNGDVFLNAVNWLGQQNDTVLSIRPKEVTNRRISMTVQQQIGLGVFSLLVLPLIGFALALVMWLRRR